MSFHSDIITKSISDIHHYHFTIFLFSVKSAPLSHHHLLLLSFLLPSSFNVLSLINIIIKIVIKHPVRCLLKYL